MDVSVQKTSIEGCYLLNPKIMKDKRGSFVKTFHSDIFEQNNLETDFKEEYYSVSNKCVLRGMHYQRPPHDHVKIAYCVKGKVIDAVVDLRVNSPTYGTYEMFELTEENANMIYIPKGLAHGFYVMSDISVMMYKVTTTYHPDYDAGIRWDSIGIPWPNSNPILSVRDKSLPSFNQHEAMF